MATHYRLPELILGGHRVRVLAACGRPLHMCAEDTDDSQQVTCKRCLERLASQAERALRESRPYHCPECSARRGVAIPAECPHWQECADD